MSDSRISHDYGQQVSLIVGNSTIFAYGIRNAIGLAYFIQLQTIST